jgi:hypothetical protein
MYKRVLEANERLTSIESKLMPEKSAKKRSHDPIVNTYS